MTRCAPAFSNATPPTVRTALTISRPQNCGAVLGHTCNRIYREPNSPLRAGAYWSVYELTHRAPGSRRAGSRSTRTESPESVGRLSMFRPAEVELGETMRLLFGEIERIDPARIVIDSLSEMRLLAQSPLRYRRQIFALKHFLGPRHATVLMIDDVTSESHDLQLHSIVHGAVTLEELALDYGAERRRLRVAKMRGIKFRGGYHDYSIRTGGLEVFPRLLTTEHSRTLPTEVIRSGSEELDALLGGGLRSGTSALLVGPAGSGKSSVALSIAYNTARQGQRADFYAFDEGTESIIERVSGIGMEVGPLITSGVIALHPINPAEMSPSKFTHSSAEASPSETPLSSSSTASTAICRPCRRNASWHSRYTTLGCARGPIAEAKISRKIVAGQP